MTYQRVRAKTYSEARGKALREFGGNVRIIKSKVEKEGGFLGIGRKKIVELLISVPDDYQLEKYKRDLNIPISDKENTPKAEKADISGIRQVKSETENDDRLDTVLTKLLELENNIKNSGNNGKNNASHSNLDELKDILKENEFSDDFINDFIDLTEKTLPLAKIESRRDLHDFTYKYLANKFKKIAKNGLVINEGKKKCIYFGWTDRCW